MKALIFIALIGFSAAAFAQTDSTVTVEKTKTEKPAKEKKPKKSKADKTSISLQNVLIIAQMDSPEDRYSIEINLADMFASKNIKAIPSLNILKMGNDSRLLATDSIQKMVAEKGVDTYCIVSIRGFDRKYTVANMEDDFATSLEQASFFELYRTDAVSVSFQIKFFRNNKCVHSEIVKCGNIGSRETVVKRFRQRVQKRIDKAWTNS
jgi:glucose/arabinose dehydrogenase